MRFRDGDVHRMLLRATQQRAVLVLGFPLGFFSEGIPANLAALFSELYPTGIRGTGVGFCYDFGRVVSAAFTFLVGLPADHLGLVVGCRGVADHDAAADFNQPLRSIKQMRTLIYRRFSPACDTTFS